VFQKLIAVIAAFFTSLWGIKVLVLPSPTPQTYLEMPSKFTPLASPTVFFPRPITSPTPKSIQPSSPKPSPTLTPTPASNTSSSVYNLTSATGAVKVLISAQGGVLVGDQIVELKAQSGAKVLVNKSTDVDTRIARQGTPEVIFSTVPPGPYSVRVKYKADWGGYFNLNVSSAQQTVTTVTVSGDPAPSPTPTPTPTPLPKPVCIGITVYPTSTGPAPLSVILQPNASSGSAGGISGYQWDFTGDGSWDTGISPDAQNYTYSSIGIYTAILRVLGTNGQYSDSCQTTITAQ